MKFFNLKRKLAFAIAFSALASIGSHALALSTSEQIALNFAVVIKTDIKNLARTADMNLVKKIRLFITDFEPTCEIGTKFKNHMEIAWQTFVQSIAKIRGLSFFKARRALIDALDALEKQFLKAISEIKQMEGKEDVVEQLDRMAAELKGVRSAMTLKQKIHLVRTLQKGIPA